METVEQWTEDEWRQFEAKIQTIKNNEEMQKLVDLTIGQEGHPDWYELPCECDTCRSFE